MADAAQQQVLKAAAHQGASPRSALPGKKRPAQGEESVGHHAEGGGREVKEEKARANKAVRGAGGGVRALSWGTLRP